MVPAPDLVLLNSFFWDTHFFAQYAVHNQFPPARQAELRAISWGELVWHRGRLAEVVQAYRDAFSQTKLMFRLGQPHNTNFADRT